ncbi:MAG: MFS transporter [Sphingomonas sp.]|uniref:MFS transporter n=1 Tax=Sphingomonas sp. TaxID=28214 RepID=UPI002274E5D1|nr:MFS transporter [Sphingomonas sp.]MCX8475950.1 MFS transporter [Sphingomonas sp.]
MSKDADPRPASPSPLAFPTFRNLWASNLLSNFGGQVQTVAAGWLMATLTGSPQMVALVQAAVSLPVMLLILLGGALADSMDKRRLLLSAQLFMLIVSSTLAALAWAGLVTPWLLLMFTFLISAGGALNNPAWQASMRDIVPREAISRAVALNSTSINLARTLGPALGGAIVATLGVAAAFLANALSYVALIVAVLRWRQPARTQPLGGREPLGSAILTGMRYAAMSPHLRPVVTRGAISGFSASAAFALMPVVARQQLGGGPMLLGALLGAFGAGAVAGALVSGRLRERVAAEYLVRAAMVLLASGLLLLGLWGAPAPAGLGAALTGAGWVLAHSSFNATVQLAAPRWVSARSLALYQTATFGAMVAGSAFFGMIAERSGVSMALVAAGTMQLLGGLLGLRMRLPAAETLNLDPLDRWTPPRLDLEVDARSGPIFVELEYRVALEDAEAFLAAMQERERIRRRDGARDWGLWRDLNDAMRWVESYRVPSWADYLRHNQRRTQEDVDNVDTLLRLHLGPDGPLIRRHVRARATRRPA